VKSMGPLFENVEIEPCLLHGDLWSGNISSDNNGEPVILDPACYCKSKLVEILCQDISA
jgi:protein-ribulosamine 3-kinase